MAHFLQVKIKENILYEFLLSEIIQILKAVFSIQKINTHQ